jgi:hypothetical protein
MLNKKCPKCYRKISRNSNFCPICGFNLSSEYDKEDYGFLGRDDFIEEEREFFGNSPSPFMEKVFNSAFKMLEKQMRELNREMGTDRRENRIQGAFPGNLDIQFYVNGKKVSPEEFSQRRIGKIERAENKQPKINKNREISEEKIKKFKSLPKKEAKSKVRRLGGKIVYEIAMPGVEDLDDVLINQLENSIEIKALSKDKVYSKIININLPISKYKLDEGNLILELKEK